MVSLFRLGAGVHVVGARGPPWVRVVDDPPPPPATPMAIGGPHGRATGRGRALRRDPRTVNAPRCAAMRRGAGGCNTVGVGISCGVALSVSVTP